MFDSLWQNGLQHTRLPCPSPSTRVCSNSCPLSQWCYPTISFSFVPFSTCPQSFPASGSFAVSWLFASDGPSIGASASASVLPLNTHSWFPLGLPSLISLQFQGLSRVFSSTMIWKHQFLSGSNNNKKATELQRKHLLLLYWLQQTFECVDNNKLWKIL